MFKKILQTTQKISLPINQNLTVFSHVFRTFAGRRNRLRKEVGNTKKEYYYGAAGSDDKFVKLTKKEDEEQRLAREKVEETKREEQRQLIKNFDLRTDLVLDEEVVRHVNDVKKRTKIDLVSNPSQGYDLIRSSLEKLNIKRNEDYEKNPEKMPEYPRTSMPKDVTLNTVPISNPDASNPKPVREFYNTEFEVNSKFADQVKMFEPETGDKRRVGVLAHKIGMTHIWDRWGIAISLTVLQVDRCQVTQVKCDDKGRHSMQVGFGSKSIRRLKKSQIGHLVKAGVPPKLKLTEFRVSKGNLLPVGYQLGPYHFNPGQYVDIQSKTKGKGTQGVMDKWNFGGQPASHGVSKAHRSLGSTGMNQDPGRVFKGKKMAGKFSNATITTINFQVYKVDLQRCLVYVKGNVPGPRGVICKVKDSRTKRDENENF